MKKVISLIITIALMATMIPSAYATKWYQSYLDDLISNGFTFGYEGEEFEEGKEVTIEYFVTGLLRLQSDIIPEEYQIGGAGQDGLRQSSLHLAKEYGIVDDLYSYDNWYNNITRYEVAKLILNYIKVFEPELNQINTLEDAGRLLVDYESYTDSEKITIDNIVAYGILVGNSNNEFNGEGTLTEAEFTAVIYRILHPETRTKLDIPDYSKELSTFSTTTTRDKNRNFNIDKAAQSINGTIIQPGEEFSYWKTIGSPNKAAGYKESTIISGGKYVKGYGGGVCQDATTLFNAALLCNLQITERRNHGLKASYVKPGYDATFATGYIDFKFVNSYDKPIKIVANFDYETLTLTVSILGAQTIEVPEVKLYTTGSGHTWTLYREVNGEVNYQTKSTYRD